MQKLVTIYLDNHAYMGKKFFRGSYADKHGFVEEHLTEYLSQGWKIADINSFGGSADLAARGWVVALLEKQE